MQEQILLASQTEAETQAQTGVSSWFSPDLSLFRQALPWVTVAPGVMGFPTQGEFPMHLMKLKDKGKGRLGERGLLLTAC